MHPALLAHTLVAAHAERVTELARLYAALERAVAVGGPHGDAARDAHRALSARIVEWNGIDREAERRDLVAIDAAEREEMQRSVCRAIAHVEAYVAELPPTARERDIAQSLQRIQAAFPSALPRADLVRFRRSAARLQALEERNAWVVVLGNEAGLLLSSLEAGAAIPPPDPDFEPGDDFSATFVWGLETCAIHEPGASRAVDLGLGTSPAVLALLGVAVADLHALARRWVEFAAPTHPFARHPFVPRGRFCRIDARGSVRGDLEEAGPIGWAAGADVSALARELAAVAEEHPALAGELRAASERVDAAARRGHAVIGLIEHLPPESDGQRNWLVED